MTKSVFSQRYERFRRLLIQARKDANLTQVILSERLGQPQSFVSKYERGERRLDLVEFLDVAQAIGLDTTEFLKLMEGADSDCRSMG